MKKQTMILAILMWGVLTASAQVADAFQSILPVTEAKIGRASCRERV